MTFMNINLRQIVFSLSKALDLVGVDDMYHGKRVAFMACTCAQRMNIDEQDYDNLFKASLLHDCGVSNTSTHLNLVEHIDWKKSQNHCIVGKNLLLSCPPLNHLAETIEYHHTHWKQLHTLPLNEQVKRDANLIFLVDRVDALISQHHEVEPIMARKDVRNQIKQYSGTMFSPELVELFLKTSESSAFWLTLEAKPLFDTLMQWVKLGEYHAIDFNTLRSIAEIFAKIVDAKSPFTAEHSQGVARLARQIAVWDGQDETITNQLELAGLLHDLGKLRIPDKILEKSNTLDESEFAMMQGHSFESHQILKDIEGFEQIAIWCSQHHEKINGTGYPYQYEGSSISRPARILAAADVFQALVQNRPYRPSLPLDNILQILSDMVNNGKLDKSVVNLITEHAQQCYQISR